MTPDERRKAIKDRMKLFGVSVHKLIIKSEYAGVRGYIDGHTSAADKHVYAMEQALDLIGAEKERAKQ